MALIYDAPSTDWTTESQITVQPRVIFPLYQSSDALIYERDYVVNPSGFTAASLDTSFWTTTLDGGIGASDTSLVLADAGLANGQGLPASGKIKINSEVIYYSSINYSTKTLSGLTRGEAEGIKTSTAASHSDGDSVSFCAWLIEETSPTQLEGGLIRWTRRYATVPDTWSDYEMRPYQFPGYYNDTSTTGYRAPYKQVVIWQVYHYYEHSPNAAVLTDIEVPAQTFQPEDQYGAPIEYIDGSSDPTYSSYTAGVSAGNFIVPSDSVMERYAGNIWVTKKFYTKML